MRRQLLYFIIYLPLQNAPYFIPATSRPPSLPILHWRSFWAFNTHHDGIAHQDHEKYQWNSLANKWTRNMLPMTNNPQQMECGRLSTIYFISKTVAVVHNMGTSVLLPSKSVKLSSLLLLRSLLVPSSFFSHPPPCHRPIQSSTC